jgi:hypothetical protein
MRRDPVAENVLAASGYLLENSCLCEAYILGVLHGNNYQSIKRIKGVVRRSFFALFWSAF